MRNFHDRISFSEYIYAIKLKNVLNNEAYQDNVDFKKNSFINSSIHFMFNNIESIIFSIDQQNYHNNNHVTIDIDILKRINQCLLITNRSKYQLLSGIKRKVFWYQLARNERLEKCEAALKNLIHIAAGPLVIFSSSSGLGQLTNWSTQALTGLLKATFIYNPNLSVNYNNDVWMEKLLLFSHVVHLSKYIDDEVGSFNLEILSSHFNLLTLILMKLPSVQVFLSTSTSSSDDRTTIQDREKFLDIIQYSFLNFCLAIGKVWLCSLCTNNLKCAPNENLSYEVISFTCKLLKSLLQLIQIPYLKVYFLKTHYNLIHSKCLFYCSQSYHSSITSQCVLYIIRIIGCICLQYHEISNNHSISLRKLSNYLSY
ncbi:hypothetical protein KSF78_0004246 [Schistosoma japonicum]|nr:hypothetical protein KSF78_0004246 [Schistosoma japonicum]